MSGELPPVSSGMTSSIGSGMQSQHHVDQTVIGQHWQAQYKIGSGSFGEIFLGTDLRTGERCAIKVESKDTKYPQLLEEYNVYQRIAGAAGVPAVYWCGTHGNCNCIVMELLGESLETLYNRCNRKFSLKTITMLAIQLLHRIEHHHNSGYLHRDIKPDNFLMGVSRNAHILYLIDMGLCKQYKDETTMQHIPYRENKKLIGTPRYASINTHLGIEQCRRDDLESIGYMLIYFYCGKLPWQGLKARTKQEKYDKISRKKMNISIETLTRGCAPQFASFLQYCRQLRFVQKPDYKYLRGLFYDLFKQKQFDDDCIYDWMLLDKAQAKQQHNLARQQQLQQQQQQQMHMPVPMTIANPLFDHQQQQQALLHHQQQQAGREQMLQSGLIVMNARVPPETQQIQHLSAEAAQRVQRNTSRVAAVEHQAKMAEHQAKMAAHHQQFQVQQQQHQHQQQQLALIHQQQQQLQAQRNEELQQYAQSHSHQQLAQHQQQHLQHQQNVYANQSNAIYQLPTQYQTRMGPPMQLQQQQQQAPQLRSNLHQQQQQSGIPRHEPHDRDIVEVSDSEEEQRIPPQPQDDQQAQDEQLQPQQHAADEVDEAQQQQQQQQPDFQQLKRESPIQHFQAITAPQIYQQQMRLSPQIAPHHAPQQQQQQFASAPPAIRAVVDLVSDQSHDDNNAPQQQLQPRSTSPYLHQAQQHAHELQSNQYQQYQPQQQSMPLQQRQSLIQPLVTPHAPETVESNLVAATLPTAQYEPIRIASTTGAIASANETNSPLALQQHSAPLSTNGVVGGCGVNGDPATQHTAIMYEAFDSMEDERDRLRRENALLADKLREAERKATLAQKELHRFTTTSYQPQLPLGQPQSSQQLQQSALPMMPTPSCIVQAAVHANGVHSPVSDAQQPQQQPEFESAPLDQTVRSEFVPLVQVGVAAASPSTFAPLAQPRRIKRKADTLCSPASPAFVGTAAVAASSAVKQPLRQSPRINAQANVVPPSRRTPMRYRRDSPAQAASTPAAAAAVSGNPLSLTKVYQ